MPRIANSLSHVEREGPGEPESGSVGEGQGDNGTDLALKEEGGEPDSEDGLGIEELGAEAGRLLQLIGLQTSDIDPDLQDCEPQAAPETSNLDPLAGP